MPINSFLYPGAKVTTGFDVANSLRFNDGSSDYLSRNEGAGNRRTFTLSAWCKRSGISSSNTIFSSGTDGEDYFFIDFSNNNHIQCLDIGSGSYQIRLDSNRLIRDLSAWYHIVLAIDTTQGTASNRVKLYVNGVQETSFSTATYPSQTYETNLNNSNTANIGRYVIEKSRYYDGYLSEVTFIDGQQLAPDQFGEFDADTGIWKPIDVSGLTFGTNGFYLDFEDSSALGNDVSGNDNDFTVNNLTAIDQSTDTCTNNFATFNSLISSKGQTFSEGNLQVATTVSNKTGGSSTIGMSSGKWFAEFKISAYNNNRTIIGITSNPSELDRTDVDPGSLNYGSGIYFDGRIYVNTSVVTTVNATTLNDIIGVALNLDDNNILYYINGVVQNSGTPISITASSSTDTGNYFFSIGDRSTSSYGTVQANFGSPPFAISSGNTDGNGYGNFEYAVPSGYYSLNSKNLAEYG
jgi:hypothetical protein